MKIQSWRQGCLYITTKTKETILVDPANKFFDEKFEYSQIEDLNYILITHAHNDHIADLEHVCTKFPNAKIFCTIELAQIIRDVMGINNEIHEYQVGAKIMLNDTVMCKVVSADHSSSYKNIYAGTANGFVLQEQDQCIYIGGDTGAQVDFEYLQNRFNITDVYLALDGKFNMDDDDAIYVMKKYFTNTICHMFHLDFMSEEEIKSSYDKLKGAGINVVLD